MKKNALYLAATKAVKKEPVHESIVRVMSNQPTRFVYMGRPLKTPIRGRTLTLRKFMTSIKFGEPGYDEAPYEMGIAFNPGFEK